MPKHATYGTLACIGTSAQTLTNKMPLDRPIHSSHFDPINCTRYLSTRPSSISYKSVRRSHWNCTKRNWLDPLRFPNEIVWQCHPRSPLDRPSISYTIRDISQCCWHRRRVKHLDVVCTHPLYLVLAFSRRVTDVRLMNISWLLLLLFDSIFVWQKQNRLNQVLRENVFFFLFLFTISKNSHTHAHTHTTGNLITLRSLHSLAQFYWDV